MPSEASAADEGPDVPLFNACLGEDDFRKLLDDIRATSYIDEVESGETPREESDLYSMIGLAKASSDKINIKDILKDPSIHDGTRVMAIADDKSGKSVTLYFIKDRKLQDSMKTATKDVIEICCNLLSGGSQLVDLAVLMSSASSPSAKKPPLASSSSARTGPSATIARPGVTRQPAVVSTSSAATRANVVSPAGSGAAARPAVRTASSTATTPIKARSSVAPSTGATAVGPRRPATTSAGTTSTTRAATARTPNTPVAPRSSAVGTTARAATSTAPARPRSSTSGSTGVRSPVSATSNAASKPVATTNGPGQAKKLRAEHEETLQELETSKADLAAKQEELKEKEGQIETLEANHRNDDAERIASNDASANKDVSIAQISDLKEQILGLQEKLKVAEESQMRSEEALAGLQKKVEEAEIELTKSKDIQKSQAEAHETSQLEAEKSKKDALSSLAAAQKQIEVLQSQIEEQRETHDAHRKTFEEERTKDASARQALEEASQTSSKSLAAAQSEIERLMKEVQEIRTEHSSELEERNERQTVENSLKEEIASLEQRYKEAEDSAKKSTAELEEKLKEAEKRYLESEKQMGDLVTTHKSALEVRRELSAGDEASKEKMIKEINDARAKSEALEADLDQAKASFDSEKSDLEEQLKIKQDKIQRKSALADELQKEIDIQKNSMKELSKAASEHHKDMESLQSQLSSVQAEAERLQDQFGLEGSKNSEEVSRLKDELSKMTVAHENILSSHKENLERMHDDHQKANASLQDQLVQMRRNAEAETAKGSATTNDDVVADLHRKIAQLEENHAMDTSILSKEHAHEQDKLHETIASLRGRVKESEVMARKLELSKSNFETIQKEKDALEGRAKALELSTESDRSRIEELEKDLADAKTALLQTQESFAMQIEEMGKINSSNGNREAQRQPMVFDKESLDLEKLHEAHNEKMHHVVQQSKLRYEALERELNAAKASANAHRQGDAELAAHKAEGEKLKARIRALEQQQQSK
ncbi:hypothetical protein MRB53_040658 [Persea americana]|nr:hypothetical protein MRB53_040658 [Persea americana]